MSRKHLLVLGAVLTVLFTSLACSFTGTGTGTEIPESALLCQGTYFLDASEKLLDTESSPSYDLCEYETTITNSDRTRAIALYLRVTEFYSDTRESIVRWGNVAILAPGESYNYTNSVYYYPAEKGDCPDDTHPAYSISTTVTGYRGVLQTDKCQGPVPDKVLEQSYRPVKQKLCK